MVRGVRGAGSEIEGKRLVRRQGLLMKFLSTAFPVEPLRGVKAAVKRAMMAGVKRPTT